MGSIGGGGRYDNLTGIFGLQNVGGVGISFGLDRIYLVLEALDLFPKAILAGPQVFFVNFGDSESLKAMTIVHKLRKLGISCDLYPSANKVQKQMKEKVGFNDRGVRQAGFLVLYKTSMPAILIEAGFLSNLKDEQFLITTKGQEYVALGIFQAFKEYKNEVEGVKTDTVDKENKNH